MDKENIDLPKFYPEILAYTQELGFSMPSDTKIGSLLRTLAISKPAPRILDLGTGTGLSLCWLVDGMDDDGHVISIELDLKLPLIALQCFADDQRVEILVKDGAQWLENHERSEPFYDLIFADTWPGKYSHLDITLSLLRPGGFYVLDDMKPQPNWPEGHHEKALALERKLDAREDLFITKLDWSTGIMICVKKG